MVVTSQRRNCSFACKCFTKWFVLSILALMDSLHVRGCTDSFHKFHNIGDDVQLNCSLSEDISGSPICRNATNFQYQTCQPDKYCVKVDNATNSIILTIANVTESDFMKYECGIRSTVAKIDWKCCFYLNQVPISSSPGSSMTSSINTTPVTMEITSQEETSIHVSNIPFARCVNETELKYRTQYEKICTKRKSLNDLFKEVTRNCLESDMNETGTKVVTVSVQHGNKSCNVTCYFHNESCEVTSPGSRTTEGSSTSSYKTAGQGATIFQTAGQSDNASTNSQENVEKSENHNMNIVIYILFGVMIALVVLIVGLCFYLCSDKKTDQTQDNSIYSHTLGDVKLTRIQLYAQNSSTSNSNHERERNENRDEKNSSDQILASEQGVATPCSETSKWEDNVAYEPCTNVTEEGDYADVNDQQLLKDEDGTKLSETEKRNRKAPTNSNSNLYECVIDKGE